MPVITISRQLGSLGCDIAHAVKEQLGYQIVWRELINQAAMRSGAPEVALAVIDELGLLGLSPSSSDIKAYRNSLQAVMEELASTGNIVIIGRGGQAILRGRPDTLHVRLTAPVDIRTSRLAARQDISLQAAMAQIKASDRYRRYFVKRLYRITWDNPDLYDIALNTAHLQISAAANIICNALENKFHQNQTTQEPSIESNRK
jgi:cytidylate kinase